MQEPGATLIPYEPETDDTVDSSGAIVPLSESQNNILANRNASSSSCQNPLARQAAVACSIISRRAAKSS